MAPPSSQAHLAWLAKAGDLKISRRTDLAVVMANQSHQGIMTADTAPETKEHARDKMIPVRVSEDEKKAIEMKASQAGYRSVSAYLRDLGQGAEIKHSLPPEVRQQLVGIGNNLNQIARLANSGKQFQSHEAQLKQALTTILGFLA